MGCCLSTTTSTVPKTNHPNAIPPNHHQRQFSESDANPRAPPQPEEETVKEVLSETPIQKQKPPIPMVTQKTSKLDVQELKIEAAVEIKPATEDIVSDVSEVSEMCSFTESFSTTVTEKRDDDGEVNQRMVERSPAKVPRRRPVKGEIAGAKERPVRSATRKSTPSPGKNTHVTPSTSLQGRTVGMQRRNVGPPNGLRRNPGDTSGRRSRSPVTRDEVGTRRNVRNKSPSPSSSTTRLSGDRSPVNKSGNGGRNLDKPNDDVSRETSESLENPLVSLECFIFL
ncbi:unnamed protein product [Ilex paraguariensis]|uniref:Uncharacterized protein n=1 Tax=Ilex paraguariensis TaxID=185542 RepID=A0ABC8SPP0_9AQUA